MADDILFDPKNSVFLEDAKTPEHHIIDTLIRERCPNLASHWTWPVVRPLLYRTLGYGRARAMADHLATLNGRDCFDYLTRALGMRVDLHHGDRIPKSGRVVIAANHPTGLADGVAVWQALREIREDIVFFANADAVRVSEGFAEVLIPVEWVMSKRSPSKTRETLKLAARAFAEEKCIVIFPSGKLAKEFDGKLTEQDWFPTVVSLARKQRAPILPLHLSARNSRLFYFVSKFSGELRDITLFRELLNKKGSHFDLTAGPMIPPDALEGDAAAITEMLREHVAYRLGEDENRIFGSV